MRVMRKQSRRNDSLFIFRCNTCVTLQSVKNHFNPRITSICSVFWLFKDFGLREVMHAWYEAYLQDLASLWVTAAVLTRVEHSQSNAVQQNNQHAGPLEPCGKQKLRNTEKKQHTSRLRHSKRSVWHRNEWHYNKIDTTSISRHSFRNTSGCQVKLFWVQSRTTGNLLTYLCHVKSLIFHVVLENTKSWICNKLWHCYERSLGHP